MRSQAHIQRLLAVLLLAGVWTLTLVWTPSSRLSEEQELAALGRGESIDTHPATETPKFGLDDDRRTALDGSAELAASTVPPTHSVSELDRLVDNESVSARRTSTPRSARGPPVRG